MLNPISFKTSQIIKDLLSRIEDKYDVDEQYKKDRAAEIAKSLSDYDKWKAHGRPLNIQVLRDLKLEIEDFGENPEVQELILECHNICEDYMNHSQLPAFICTRGSL